MIIPEKASTGTIFPLKEGQTVKSWQARWCSEKRSDGVSPNTNQGNIIQVVKLNVPEIGQKLTVKYGPLDNSIKNSHNCNKVSYNRFRNTVTGQWSWCPRGRYGNYLNAIKKVKQYVQYNFARQYVVHLTLTIANPDDQAYLDRAFHRVQQMISHRIKRAGGQFKCIAVKEVQKERLEKYGDVVLHLHVLCFYDKAYIFPSWADIKKSWGIGGVDITAPKGLHRVKKITNYLSKYIGKGFDYGSLEVRKSFSSSQVKQIYKLSKDRLKEVIDTYGVHRAADLKCTYSKVFDGGQLIKQFKSDWVYWGQAYEPF